MSISKLWTTTPSLLTVNQARIWPLETHKNSNVQNVDRKEYSFPLMKTIMKVLQDFLKLFLSARYFWIMQIFQSQGCRETHHNSFRYSNLLQLTKKLSTLPELWKSSVISSRSEKYFILHPRKICGLPTDFPYKLPFINHCSESLGNGPWERWNGNSSWVMLAFVLASESVSLRACSFSFINRGISGDIYLLIIITVGYSKYLWPSTTLWSSHATVSTLESIILEINKKIGNKLWSLQISKDFMTSGHSGWCCCWFCWWFKNQILDQDSCMEIRIE